MASEVTRVTIGDYEYRLYDDQTAGAMVTDTSKASYGALQTSVTHQGVSYALTSLRFCFAYCASLTTAPSIPDGVIDMYNCFAGCTFLTTAPSIPSSVTDMNSCFINCRSITTAPAIPSSVTNMSYCFVGCTSLTTAPSIPDGVTSMNSCFYGCTSLTTAVSIPSSVMDVSSCFIGCTDLTGTIAVHGTPTYYTSCFYSTIQPIVLEVFDTGTAPTWQAVARTGNNGNVTVRDVSANPAPTATITAVRVASSGSTTPDETGQYAYVTVRTTASTEQAPDNVAQAPTITLDGATYTPADPSGTATFTCHVSLGNDLGHVIGATPRDTYKTGTPVTVTLASTYSPMEFHATPVYDEHGVLKGYIGGDGASFGKHATRAGVLDVAWDIESEGDISADGALSCADGSPYCKDGTDVKVGGATVGSADNLSYVLHYPNVGWQTLIDNQYGFVQYCRYAGVVYISYQASHSGYTPAVSGEYQIGTMPVGFRPGAEYILSFVPTASSFHTQMSWWKVQPDGAVKIRLQQAMTTWGTTNYPAS